MSAGRSSRGNPAGYRGQVLVILAAALVMLVGLVGLAVDLGYSFSQKRTMQNAADAGALAGAHFVAKSDPSLVLSHLSDINAIVEENRLGSTTPNMTECSYVDDFDVWLGPCSLPVPAGTTGVRVTVTETHNTFFMRAIPGGPTTAQTSATATAHIQKLAKPPGDGPFLVCGSDTKLASGGGNMNIINQVGGQWVLNQSALDKWFMIHGPQIASCGSTNSSYKGISEQLTNLNSTVPGYFVYTTGTVAGPVSSDVQGAQGCKAGQPVDNCVAFLPISVNDPTHPPIDKKLWTVAFAPFYIRAVDSNVHHGKLLGDYVVYGGGQPGWTPQYIGPIVIRLTD